MSRRRVAVLVAIMAALAGAPPSAFAAAPNELSQASVLPSAGNTGTSFLVTVRYRSEAGHPALTVTADAGGSINLLTLIDGTTTDGHWSGTMALPAGTWEVTLRAVVASGPSPTLSAGIINVSEGTIEPSPTGDDSPSVNPGAESGGSGSSTAPAPAATPRQNAAATAAPEARSTSQAAPSQPPTGPSPGDAAPQGPGRSGKAPRHTQRPDPAGSNDGAQLSSIASPSAGGEPAPIGARDDLGLFMLMGMLAVGSVALVGTAWAFMAGRRERRAATVAARHRSNDPGVNAASIVEQRALRRARLRSSDDPILAAMGLPDEGTPPGPKPPPSARTRSGRSRRRPPPGP